MKPTFENTVNILVQAYLNDTLEHGNCAACAVGNIVAASCNYEYLRRTDSCLKWMWSKYTPDWYCDFVGVQESEQTRATGYSVEELNRIEMAFESVPYGTDDMMFQGLMRVIEALARIHGVDLSVKENAKLLFVK